MLWGAKQTHSTSIRCRVQFTDSQARSHKKITLQLKKVDQSCSFLNVIEQATKVSQTFDSIETDFYGPRKVFSNFASDDGYICG